MAVCAQRGHFVLPQLRHWIELYMAQAKVLVWRTWDAKTPGHSLFPLARSNGKDKPKQLVPGWLQELPEGLWCKTSHLLESTPDFLLEFTPLAFAIPMTSARQRKFIVRIFLLCMSQLPHGYMVPVASRGPELT